MAHSARELTFDWSSTTLVGVKSRSMGITNDFVDVTNDDDAGWRTLLATPGLRALEVTLGIIVSDEILLTEIMAASVASDTLKADLPSSLASPGNLSGSWLLSNLEYSGDSDGVVELNATFLSTGAIVYTASSA